MQQVPDSQPTTVRGVPRFHGAFFELDNQKHPVEGLNFEAWEVYLLADVNGELSRAQLLIGECFRVSPSECRVLARTCFCSGVP